MLAFVLFVVITAATLYILPLVIWSLFATARPAEKPKVVLTENEKNLVEKLSQQYSCEVDVDFPYTTYITRNDTVIIPTIFTASLSSGVKTYFIDSTGMYNHYTVLFHWTEENAQKGKEIWSKDTADLRKYALSLLPELDSTMRYIKDFHTIRFSFMYKYYTYYYTTPLDSSKKTLGGSGKTIVIHR